MKKTTHLKANEGRVACSDVSAQQQRLWILNKLANSSAAYNVPIFLRLVGSLDHDSLQKSLDALMAGNEILRSRFVIDRDKPSRTVGRNTSVVLRFVDVTSCEQERRAETAIGLALEELRKPFDLEQDCLVRARVFRLHEQEHLLILVAHQTVCDSASTSIIASELLSCYSDLVDNRELRVREEVDYSIYTRWQQEYLRSNRAINDLGYWKRQLADCDTGLELPIDFPRPAEQNFRASDQSLIISGDLLSKCRDLSRSEGVSLFEVLLSAFFALLSRYSALDNIVIGTEVAGREHPAADSFIGCFANLLVLRGDLSGDPGFQEILKRTAAIWHEATSRQDLPFAQVIDHFDLDRDLSKNPLFQVMFSLQSPTTVLPKIPGLNAEFLRLPTVAETLDLSIRVFDLENEAEIRFSYSTSLFAHSTIARMSDHYQILLRAAVEHSELKLSELPLMPAAEQDLLAEWNNTKVDFPLHIPLHRFVEHQAEQSPDNVALIYESVELTYRQLNQRANQLAHRLIKLGIGPDALVGVCAERSIEMVVALLGVLKAGGAYIPLDPDYPKDRLHKVIEDALPPVLLTQERLLERIPETAAHVIFLDRDWDEIRQEPTNNTSVEVNGKNLIYVIYTSGSTGKPKGVPNVHEGIVDRLLWLQSKYPLTAADRLLQKTPYSFDVSVLEFFWPLMTGACLVIARPGGHKDPSYLARVILQQGITTINFVPSMMSLFVDAGVSEQCCSLRRVFASGEALPLDLQQRFLEQFDCELHNLYGPTEAAVEATYWQCTPETRQVIVPIGRPIANTQIHILDRNLRPVPIGVAGELHIGGVGLARGYLNLPELTAEKFIRDPFSEEAGARLYKSGDLARFRPDGNIEYLGRIDRQVKLRGFRIELGEIEAALVECRGVRQATVVLREDTPGDKRLVAYLTRSTGQSIDPKDVRRFLKERLPEYMVPSSVVMLEALPLTTSGKVDGRALPPPQREVRSGSPMIAPRTELEAMLVSTFKNILGIRSLGATDDFFDLGGHSLMAARLVSEVEKSTGKVLPLSVLYRGATPEYLARALQTGIDSYTESIAVPIQAGTGSPVFFAVVPPGENAVGYVTLARHLGPNQPLYKVQTPGPALADRPYTGREMQLLANKYVDAMRAVQPEGPYYFGGMCDGAHIGLYVARTIEAQGEQVGMLGVFDTWVLENTQRRGLWHVHYYSSRLKNFFKLSTRSKMQTAISGIQKLARAIGGGGRTLWYQAYWPSEDFVAPIFGGRVTLFKRPKQPYYYVDDPTMGWSTRAARVDIQVLPIDHEEMLHEPYVRVLAQRLAQCLQNYYGESPAEPSDHNAEAYATAAPETQH